MRTVKLWKDVSEQIDAYKIVKRRDEQWVRSFVNRAVLEKLERDAL